MPHRPLSQPGRLQDWIVTTAKHEGLRLRQLGQRTVLMTCDADDAGPALANTLADDAPVAEDQLAELQ